MGMYPQFRGLTRVIAGKHVAYIVHIDSTLYFYDSETKPAGWEHVPEKQERHAITTLLEWKRRFPMYHPQFEMLQRACEDFANEFHDAEALTDDDIHSLCFGVVTTALQITLSAERVAKLRDVAGFLWV